MTSSLSKMSSRPAATPIIAETSSRLLPTSAKLVGMSGRVRAGTTDAGAANNAVRVMPVLPERVQVPDTPSGTNDGCMTQ